MTTPTAAPLVPGDVQFFDNSGAPLESGLLYTYVANTLTSKTTWQDPTQTTANSNPINLDSSGRAVIWGSGIYRLQLFDQLGNLIWDQPGEATDPNYINGLAPVFGGDTGTGGTQGIVPAPPAGSAAAGDYLKADGTWGPLTVTVPAVAPAPNQAGFLTPTLRTITTVSGANNSLKLSDAGCAINYNNPGTGVLVVTADVTTPWNTGVVTQVLVNNLSTSGNLTLTQDAAGVSLLWPGSSATPANRVLAPNGQCVLTRIAGDIWNVMGAGLS